MSKFAEKAFRMNIIDKIQAIRAKNNQAWMDILRLAIEAEPERAKEIMAKVAENDNKVTELMKEMAA